MLLKVDAAQLEWRVKAFLAQDKVAMQEIEELAWRPKTEDLHSQNKIKFNLPNRTIAKNFVYRMIFADAFGKQGYQGPAYAYSSDADFRHVSNSVSYWTGVVRSFFEKYPGMEAHSINLIRTACDTGRIISPSGRIYLFAPVRTWSGEIDWPRTKILNYIVQGFSADLMFIARLLLRQRFPELGYGQRALLINTVHDDDEADVDNDPEIVYNISLMLRKCFKDIPIEFEKRFGVKINVPMDGEVKMGWTLFEKDMVEFKEKSFEEDWNLLMSKKGVIQLG